MVPSRQCVCVCEMEVILDLSDAGIMRRIGERETSGGVAKMQKMNRSRLT